MKEHNTQKSDRFKPDQRTQRTFRLRLRFVIFLILYCTFGLSWGFSAITEKEKTVIEKPCILCSSFIELEHLCWMLGGCGIVTLLTIVWSVLLRKKVKCGTIELQNELQRRINTEQHLHQAEEQFRHVIEFCPLGIHMYQLENHDRLVLTGANTAAEKILGIELRPCIGKTILEVFPALAQTDIPDRYRQICKTGIPWQTQFIEYKDERIEGKYEVYAFRTSAGKIAVMFSDITERIAARQAVEQSEALLSSIFRAAPIGIGFVVDRIFKHVNDRLCSMLGYTPDELLGRNSRMIYPDQEEYEKVGSEKYAQIRQVGIGTVQTRWRRKDGVILNILLSSAAIDAQDLSKGTTFTALDITEQVAAQKSLQFFQFAVELSGEASFWTDPQGRLVYVNNAACMQLGYSREELKTMAVKDIDPIFPVEQWPSHWVQIKEKRTVRLESCHKTKDGVVFPVEITANYVCFDGKEYNCALVRDIRERKRYEQTIETFIRITSSTTGQDLFRFYAQQIAEQLRADIVVVGQLSESKPRKIQTLAIFKDGDLHDNFSYSPEGTPCGKVISENSSLYFVKDNVAELFPQDTLLSQEHLRGYIGIPLLDTRQKPIGLICVLFRKPAEEITFADSILKIFASQTAMELQRIAAQEDLSYSEYRFREMFQQMSSAVAVYQAVDDGADFIFTDFNPAGERIEKIDKKNVIGRRVTEVFPGVAEFGILDVFRQVWKTGQSMHYPLGLYKDDRIVGWRSNYIYRLPGGEVIALYDDVTERIMAEQAREKLMKELQTKNEELESIVFVASHDLRSPLVNIQGFAGELQKSCRELTVLLGRENLSETSVKAVRRILDEDIPESLNFISAGTNKMDALAKGLLRLARIGTVQITINAIDMNRLMATIFKTVQYQTREYDIKIQTGKLPACMGDWEQLNQVFSNLIDNAMKFRHPVRKAVIEVSGEVRDNRVRYIIRDNGIGIAKEHTKKIFEVFHRLNPGGPIKGEGLGLTIVQRILDRLDGTIDVESQPDIGTDFIVELPAAV